MGETPGSAGLVLVEGVVHLDEAAAVFEAILRGWERQQKSRMLAEETVKPRLALLRRFAKFAESYPWAWTPGDVEDFTVWLTSGDRHLAPATIRGHQLSLRMFCDYLTDADPLVVVPRKVLLELARMKSRQPHSPSTESTFQLFASPRP